ncbi:hypothetical protein [Amycolatopsis alkalitolerans]|uniref:Uncharacterized protein n=1 Tax=Amycolatopsis alkalitolerans TaxID=2547244 RepID=A0A5C4M9K1_9PSEU|nr:hypothetical protein [Amycolatopsis alkalitolerans]TNC28599.1 hypothetical protein FG385_04875 [Amycolatopsis alkalitolerans]
MTKQTTLGDSAQNRLAHLGVDDGRHAATARHLAESFVHKECRCDELPMHRHSCSYDDVISLLSASAPEPGGP